MPGAIARDAARETVARDATPLVPGTKTPMCSVFGECGGCDSLDVPIAQQIAAKVARIEAAIAPVFAKSGQAPVPVAFTIPDRVPLDARTRLLYPAQRDAAGLLRLGLYAAGSHRLVAIRDCRTQLRALTELGIRVERILQRLGLPAYEETSGEGFVRALQARVAPGSGELLVGIVTTAGEFPLATEFADAVFEAAETLPRLAGKRLQLLGVMRSIATAKGNFLLGERHLPLRGRDYLLDRQGGLTFRVSLASFYQVHRDAQWVLYGPALAMLGVDYDDAVRSLDGARVVDGYGGIGTFGLRLARMGAAAVEIVEDHRTACADARDNVVRNGMQQVARVIEGAFATADFAERPDLLVLDPPRRGLGPDGVERALRARPARILHVACSLAALQRDLEGLVAGGYAIRGVRLCDLFPHTEHAEVVVVLEREASDEGSQRDG